MAAFDEPTRKKTEKAEELEVQNFKSYISKLEVSLSYGTLVA